MFNVKLEKFEGPLNLLLELIEERQLDISEVSIAKVADDYLEFVRQDENISLENLSEFVNIASKIILIKSRNILPTLEFSPDEEKEIKDLEEQLTLYKKFKEASRNIANRISDRNISYARDYLLGTSQVFIPPKDISLHELKSHFMRLIDQIVLPEKIPETAVKEIITLEEKIDELQQSLRKKIELSFSQIHAGSKDKIEVIVSFLALLELVKQRIVSAEQNEIFSEIRLKISENN